MPRVLLLAAIVISVWYWWTVVRGMPADKRRPFLWRSAFWGIFGLSVILVATGRMHWLGAGLAALIPLAKGAIALSFRALPFLQILSRFKTSPSQFRTKSLLMEINFANRAMDGEVLDGEFAGKRLSELSDEQLRQLSESLRSTDRESFVLLQAYLMRNGQSGQTENFASNDMSDLTIDEAYKILGLEPESPKADVLKAHKRLIQKLHPDRGGSDYLAAKINAAKDKLV
ncbi:molecular chaperone DnaJ [Porticoccaceae bacterium]|nr:molecular chaperone DnaJ [Porticoccaceae bacterium]